MDTEPPAGQTHIDHLQRRSQPGEGEHEMSQTNARRRALVLVLGLLAAFAVLWITASAGDRAEAQQNTPATGTVTITGTVGIGELLTAHASGITDADGLTNITDADDLTDPEFLVLWLTGPTSDPTDATGRLYAYGERYHVLPLDAGLRIMVSVSFYDDAGNLESLHSVATGVVATVAPASPGDLTASSTAPGELSLRWQAPSWGIRDWLDERSNVGNGGSDITGYKVQWKLSTGSWNVPADVSEETAAGETHTITNLTGGQTYTLRVVATNDVGDSEPSREITQAVQAQPNTPASGTVTITGTVGIGELLTAHASGITDADGLTNPNFLLLWLAGPTSDPTDANIRFFAYGERYHVLPLDAGLRIMVGRQLLRRRRQSRGYPQRGNRRGCDRRASPPTQPHRLLDRSGRAQPALAGSLLVDPGLARRALQRRQWRVGHHRVQGPVEALDRELERSRGCLRRNGSRGDPHQHHHEPHRRPDVHAARHRHERGGRQPALPGDHAGD